MAHFDKTVEAKDRAAGRLSLIAVGDDKVVSVELPASGSIVIGRDADADMQLPHPEVSRKHAKLIVGPVQRIQDLGSANGTVLRGEKLRPNQPALFEKGETLVIGPYIVALKDHTAAQRTNTKSPALVFESRAMEPVLERVDKVARGKISVLLLGETGTGKEILAERVHQLSGKSGRLVRVNCAAISGQLFESELFGHEKGAFTGADAAKAGLLEAADGGTLFLDEVGELPEGVQAKLLRVIEQREVVRVGSTEARKVDVRFVSATNRDLAEESKQGRFRGDLFFRLSGISVAIPPLRERREDIRPLAKSFVTRFAEELGLSVPSFSDEALRWLDEHDWPGNIRELRNRIERAILLQSDGVIELEHLHDEPKPAARNTGPVPSAPIASTPTSPAVPSLRGGNDEEWHRRRQQILDALTAAGGNQKAAAEILGVDRKTLGRHLDKYEIPRPRKG